MKTTITHGPITDEMRAARALPDLSVGLEPETAAEATFVEDLRARLAMPLVVIESPYAPTPTCTVEDHVAYAKRCFNDSLKRGEAPYASHLLFTQPGLLDDTIPEQRRLGIEAGLAWGAAAKTAALYIDFGISSGMRTGINRHAQNGTNIVVRALDRKVTNEDIADLAQGLTASCVITVDE